MQFRCPEATVVGTAVIPDYELLFKGSLTGAYLTIEPKQGSQVPVGVWEVSLADELKLDRYEGFPSFYYKKEMRISIADIRTGKTKLHDGFVYIMHEDRKLGTPTDMYVRTCIEGYRDFGFNPDCLLAAYDRSL
nr:MAG TPA: hypothetical protein [Caudoviricetes sp.]